MNIILRGFIFKYIKMHESVIQEKISKAPSTNFVDVSYSLLKIINENRTQDRLTLLFSLEICFNISLLHWLISLNIYHGGA